MKIVALSDTHGRHEDVVVPDGDLLIFAGDMTLSGAVEDVIDFNEWLGTLPHPKKIVTAGNHDSCLLQECLREFITNAYLVIDKTVRVEATLIYVSPASRRFSDRGAFALSTAKDARKHWSVIPHDVDILVTHGPPQGVLDIDEEVTGAKPQGCPVLRDWVEIHKPSVHIFGHIHRDAGAWASEHTQYHNCAIASDSEHTKFDNTPHVLTI